jgi:phage-related protein
MPTIKDKLYFNFGGIWSNDYNLMNVVLDNSMYEESLVAPREIIETKVRNSNKPIFHSIDESPLQFEMTVAFESAYTDEDIDSIIRWLFVDYYRPLFFEGKEDKIYMAMPIDDPKIVHNGLNEGYFTLMMRCDSSNLYSPTVTTELETIIDNKTITIFNDGHYDIYPEISFIKNGAGNITIQSLDDDGNIFEVRDLTNLEDIYINCEKETIQTDIIGMYRYDKIIGEFPRILYGENRFKITGSCSIQFRYKIKYRF